MKRFYAILWISLSMLSLPFSSLSQQWAEMMKNPNANFYDIQAEFQNYWAGKTIQKVLELGGTIKREQWELEEKFLVTRMQFFYQLQKPLFRQSLLMWILKSPKTCACDQKLKDCHSVS